MLRRLNRGLALALALVGSACTEDGSVCLALCAPGLDVWFESPAPLPDGDYEIEVTLPDGVLVCPRTYPSDNPEVDAGECGPESPTWVTTIQPAPGERTGFVISTRETPETIGVTIRHEGVVLVSESFTPVYERKTVCRSSCLKGREGLRLPALSGGDAGVSNAP